MNHCPMKDFQDLLDSIENGEMKSQPKANEPKEEKVLEVLQIKIYFLIQQKKQLDNAIKKQKIS